MIHLQHRTAARNAGYPGLLQPHPAACEAEPARDPPDRFESERTADNVHERRRSNVGGRIGVSGKDKLSS